MNNYLTRLLARGAGAPAGPTIEPRSDSAAVASAQDRPHSLSPPEDAAGSPPPRQEMSIRGPEPASQDIRAAAQPPPAGPPAARAVAPPVDTAASPGAALDPPVPVGTTAPLVDGRPAAPSRPAPRVAAIHTERERLEPAPLTNLLRPAPPTRPPDAARLGPASPPPTPSPASPAPTDTMVRDAMQAPPEPAIPVAVPRANEVAEPDLGKPRVAIPEGPPKVEVHIDRIELGGSAQPHPAPRPAPPPPRGFGEHAAARRFVDRGWV